LQSDEASPSGNCTMNRFCCYAMAIASAKRR
jgi:hypothetical protein